MPRQWWGHPTTTRWQKKNCALRGGRDINFQELYQLRTSRPKLLVENSHVLFLEI